MHAGGAQRRLHAGKRDRLHQLRRYGRLQRRVAAPRRPAEEEERVVETVQRREDAKDVRSDHRRGGVVCEETVVEVKKGCQRKFRHGEENVAALGEVIYH